MRLTKRFQIIAIILLVFCITLVFIFDALIFNVNVKPNRITEASESENYNLRETTEHLSTIEMPDSSQSVLLNSIDAQIEVGDSTDNQINQLEEPTLNGTEGEKFDCQPIFAEDVFQEESLSWPFDYVRAPLSSLKERADKNDGYAQYYYANSLINKYIKGSSLGTVITETKIYRLKTDLKTIKLYNVLAIKNGWLEAAERNSFAHWLEIPRPDYLSAYVWLLIYELMGGEHKRYNKHHENFADLDDEAVAIRTINLTHAYSLWDRRHYVTEDGTSPWRKGYESNNISGEQNFADRILDCQMVSRIYASPPGDEIITNETTIRYRQGEDPFITAALNLNAYAKELMESDLLADPTIAPRLAQTFKDIRLSFIISAKTGNRDALRTLISMHRDYDQEVDPIEALAWEFVATSVGVESIAKTVPTDFLGIDAKEIENQAIFLADLYQRVFNIQ